MCHVADNSGIYIQYYSTDTQAWCTVAPYNVLHPSDYWIVCILEWVKLMVRAFKSGCIMEVTIAQGHPQGRALLHKQGSMHNMNTQFVL